MSIRTIIIPLIIIGSLVVASTRIAIAQGQISSSIQNELSSIYVATKDIEQGQNLAWQLQYVERALSKEKRAEYFQKFELNGAEKKALEARLDKLAETAPKFGITLESIAESEKLASNPAYKFTLDELIKVTGQVKNFDPKQHTFIVNSSDGKWLLRAVSERDREQWAKDFFNGQDDIQQVFYKRLQNLSTLATTVLPTFKPNQKNFANRSASEEDLLKKQLGDLSAIKIHQIGLAQNAWTVQKNNFDIPQKRFKVGYVWTRDSKKDHAYCQLHQINIIQEYEGGGRYGSSNAVYIDSWLTGCP